MKELSDCGAGEFLRRLRVTGHRFLVLTNNSMYNPLMMRSALRAIDAHSETTVMIGDRMDTDIVAGMEGDLPAEIGRRAASAYAA